MSLATNLYYWKSRRVNLSLTLLILCISILRNIKHVQIKKNMMFEKYTNLSTICGIGRRRRYTCIVNEQKLFMPTGV